VLQIARREPMRRLRPDNEEISDLLERIADLLEAQGANAYRVRAYRAAALTARESAEPLTAIDDAGGHEALERLPGIGKSIGALLHEYAHTGRAGLLDRLEGQVSPEDLFSTVPGIGEQLAVRIHRELGIETLEDLELAAHDGRLERVRGLGPRTVHGIRDAVAGILNRSARRRAQRWRRLEVPETARLEPEAAEARPTVTAILAVDAEYRRQAQAGTLPTITPRRFNPRAESWLPILHTDRNGWSFTALYSNTARAHELGTTRDWVVIYYERDGDERQCTVVSERRGLLRGQRVVRGRESESAVSRSGGAETGARTSG
jgi:DNA uptake protein ComE-like DNA-binding protein